MSYFDKINTSLFGRRLGLQVGSTNVTGSGRAASAPDFLVGPEALRFNVHTGTTGTNLPAYGVVRIDGTSAASSCVYTLDPPIPGVPVLLVFGTSGNVPFYVKTANGETIISSQGTTMSVIKTTGALAAGMVELMGVTTAIWAARAGHSSASVAFSTTT